MEPFGDFAKQHVLNPALLRLLGEVRGRRLLDVGCGHGYLSRMLADRGAEVVGVEPGQSLFDFAVGKEAERPRGIRYVQADLVQLPDLGGPFDAVMASMVLPAISRLERGTGGPGRCGQPLVRGTQPVGPALLDHQSVSFGWPVPA
jgi:2-polyprenyl-3-methyl-5-hydroxy-6-metoxy-1,4-benzoquinol methylase